MHSGRCRSLSRLPLRGQLRNCWTWTCCGQHCAGAPDSRFNPWPAGRGSPQAARSLSGCPLPQWERPWPRLPFADSRVLRCAHAASTDGRTFGAYPSCPHAPCKLVATAITPPSYRAILDSGRDLSGDIHDLRKKAAVPRVRTGAPHLPDPCSSLRMAACKSSGLGADARSLAWLGGTRCERIAFPRHCSSQGCINPRLELGIRELGSAIGAWLPRPRRASARIGTPLCPLRRAQPGPRRLGEPLRTVSILGCHLAVAPACESAIAREYFCLPMHGNRGRGRSHEDSSKGFPRWERACSRTPLTAHARAIAAKAAPTKAAPSAR